MHTKHAEIYFFRDYLYQGLYLLPPPLKFFWVNFILGGESPLYPPPLDVLGTEGQSDRQPITLLLYFCLGKNSLIHAVKNENTDVVKILLEHGADVNSKDNDG